MDVCTRCGKPVQAAHQCVVGSSPAPAMKRSSMPPVGGSIPPGAGSGDFAISGGFGISGAYDASQGTVHRSLRLLKTQFNLAIGQRSEDPERAWLEAMSVRERLVSLAVAAQDDRLLMTDLDRFRGKLEVQLRRLTLDMGDEIVAPLYSWVDLTRQRERLQGEVEAASARVLEARASRGTGGTAAPTTLEETSAALDECEKQAALWRASVPPPPSAEAIAIWNAAGADSLRPTLSHDRAAVAARGLSARRRRDAIVAAATPLSGYWGSRRERGVLAVLGATAVAATIAAFSVGRTSLAISTFAIVACGSFAATAAAGLQVHGYRATGRRAAIDWVWHHTLTTEQVASLDIEAGWLRALMSALRARQAFDARGGEGGQLAELAKWRPDLEAVVADVAKASLPPSPF